MAKGQTKHKSQKYKKLMLIRYGRIGHLGWFEHNKSYIPKTASRVVIKTDRGLELGYLVGRFCYRGGHFKSNLDQVQEYFGKAQKDYPLAEGGTFVRFATPQDIMEERHLDASAKEEMECCERFVKEMDLSMKIVDAEHLFGGERIIIYFTSNGRVDFRELVKRLAKEYQTRIELRQIGARDEARIISDYESCGLPCCCKSFLKILEPVNMRMAKLQKATLDPSKISGHCGRLKCCLRYEDATYKELKEKLPKKNTMVKTSKGTGKVVDVQILTQLVVVQDNTGEKKAFPVDEVEIIDEKSKTTEPALEDSGKEQADTTAGKVDVETIKTAGPDGEQKSEPKKAEKAKNGKTRFGGKRRKRSKKKKGKNPGGN
jgi:cell fate regulator YaaT (PSP1 superfamily)